MVSSWVNKTSGMPVNEVLGIANQQRANAQKTLGECYEVYKNCLASNPHMDPYQKGRIRGIVWELEQSFGHNHLYFSQSGQDRYVHEHFFKNQPTGTFLEIGGYNGWRGSNCYFFEKTLKWQGAIAEASPSQINEIRKCRDARIVHAAIADVNGTAEFIEVVSGLPQMSGLRKYLKEDMIKQVRSYNGHHEQIASVPAMTLGTLLDSLHLSQVDYCSIDVEGAERAILSGFDFAAYDIKVFSVETGSATNSVKDILVPAGYRLVDIIGVDEIYVKQS